ncbi:hypothetical protein HELRODRAFT_125362, partial [Helobdella robusta]|uniref:SAM domain-containing protein n=1 Tax=Helobdella robusta TaxID=6412 RepID=T1EH55_HELRO
DQEVLVNWLNSFHMLDLAQLFIDAGYDMATITKMTPEDLNAIGITKPAVRKKVKVEINKLKVPDGVPNFIPGSVYDWLTILNLCQYEETLLGQGYKDINSVMQITWEDLEDIGVKKLGHQKKLMLAINRLKKL